MVSPSPRTRPGVTATKLFRRTTDTSSFLARVAELSRVLRQDAAAVIRATRDGSLLDTDEDWKRLAARTHRDYGKGTFLLNRLGAQRSPRPYAFGGTDRAASASGGGLRIVGAGQHADRPGGCRLSQLPQDHRMDRQHGADRRGGAKTAWDYCILIPWITLRR